MKNQQVINNRRVMSGTFKRQAAFLTMLIPGVILLLLFNYLPMPGVIMAFKKYRLGIPPKDFWIQNKFIYSLFVNSKWVGMSNFEFLIKSPDTFKIIRNTVGYNVLFMVVGVFLQVGLAIAINELRNRRAAKVYQSVLFLPYFISWIIVMYVVYAFISLNGVFNKIGAMMGMDQIRFYGEKQYWPWIFLFSNIWKYTGQGSIIYLATISGFDQELYEAAAIDGASKWQQIKHIMLPQLVPVIVMLQILAVGRIFNGDFEMYYSLPNGSGVISDVTNTIDVYVYSMMRTGSSLGYPAAGALFQSIVGFVLVLTTNIIVRKAQPEMALF